MMRDGDIDTLSANGAQEAWINPNDRAHHPYCQFRREGTDCTCVEGRERTYHVLFDVNRYDPDEGRAWVSVEAYGPAEAKQKVRELYPNAAVLSAESDEGAA